MPEAQKHVDLSKAPVRPEEPLQAIYLVPEFEEKAIAEAWLAKYDPEALSLEKGVRVYTEIHMHNLNRGMIVHCLVRKPKTRKGLRPTQPVTESPIDGQRITTHVEPEEFIDEVVLGKGVKVADHWEEGASRFTSKLMRASFYNALALEAHPWRLATADAASFRGGEESNYLVIRNC